MHFWVFHTLPVRAMTANAAEVHLAEILQRIEAALAGPPTPAAQQAAAKDAQFAHVALQARIAAFERFRPVRVKESSTSVPTQELTGIESSGAS